MKIKITREVFHIAYSISRQRQGNFTNQFTTSKLKEQFSDDPEIAKNIEGGIGYIGDSCAGIILGLDSLYIMRNMVLDTDLLAQRVSLPTSHSFSPAGAKLWTPAHCIPNEDLEDLNLLLNIKMGSHKQYSNHI